MDLIKCGLCGFEFERGVKICRGCHGRVKYGSGVISIAFGLIYAWVFQFGLEYIDSHFFKISGYIKDIGYPKGWVASFGMLAFFLIGFFHALYLFRNRVVTTKK